MPVSRSIVPHPAHAEEAKPRVRRQRHKGAAPSEVTRAELEHMLLQTAFLRAEAARRRSRD
jgi:hypothetical protein